MTIRSIRYLAIAFAVVALPHTVFGKPWRNIVPLRSTRVDVQKLLGAPKQSSDYSDYYRLSKEIVVVWYQTLSCDEDTFGITWNVPKGTVTDIGVIPTTKYPKEHVLSGSDFMTTDANAGFFHYEDPSQGLSVETFNGVIALINYSATKNEETRRCPTKQKCCWDLFPRFDEYRLNLPFEDEKARLDNYAIAITNQMGRGALVVYGKSRSERLRLMKQVERSRKYLVKQRGIEAQRILIVDGGYREVSELALELYAIGPAGWMYFFPEYDRD